MFYQTGRAMGSYLKEERMGPSTVSDFWKNDDSQSPAQNLMSRT
jgi:hypothetical protein